MSRSYLILTVICLALSHHVTAVEIEIIRGSQQELGAPPLEEEEQQGARIQLALKMAADGTYGGFRDAVRVLGETSELSGSELELWLVLHFKRLENSSRRQALELLDQIAEGRELTPTEMFLQARLCATDGSDERWEEAKQIFDNLLQGEPKSPDISDFYARQLIDHDEFEEAQRIPAASSITQLRARLLNEVNAGRIDRAIESLNFTIPKAVETPHQRKELSVLASIAEELGEHDPAFYAWAQEKLTTLAEGVPHLNFKLLLSRGLHGEIGAVKSALQELRVANELAAVPSAERAGAALLILREKSQLNNRLQGEVEETGKWIKRLGKKSADDSSLRSRMAEFYDMTGDLERAKAEYSIIVEAEELQPVERGICLNNFAYDLALTGDPNRASDVIQEAKELVGPIAEILDTEGFCSYSRGKYKRAIKLFRLAIVEDSSVSAHKQFHLTLALDKVEDPAAREAWRATLDAGLEEHQVKIALQDEFQRLDAKYRDDEPKASE